MNLKIGTVLFLAVALSCAMGYAAQIRRLWSATAVSHLRHFWTRRPGIETSLVLFCAIGVRWASGAITGSAAIAAFLSIALLLEAIGEFLYRRKTAPRLVLPGRRQM